MTDNPYPNWRTTFQGKTEIEVAWNPIRRQSEPIFREDEGYEEAAKVRLHWCCPFHRYVSIPVDERS